MTAPFKVGELFAGYGGIYQALSSVYDTELAWYAENAEAPAKVMAHHYPGVINHRDVTTVDWHSVEQVDILTGGFPCQSVSVGGRRAGMVEGAASNIWTEMARAIKELRPRMVVIENVRGLFSARSYGTVGSDGEVFQVRAFEAVLGTLSDLGYDAEWVTLKASDVGAPHRRERVFITAHSRSRRGGGGSIEPIASEAGESHAPADWADDRPVPPWGAEAVALSAFGEYAPAIERWERVTRNAVPFPTTPGGRSRPVLSIEFMEWIMGLPPGWVSGVPGIKHREAARILGNGVVPQQCEAALRWLHTQRE